MVALLVGVRGALVGVLAASVLVVSACGSGSGGTDGGPSTSQSPTVSVAPGVAKDSVLDLNSTKDMTGVVTTVPIGKSPYDKNMPDICGFITQTAMTTLGMATKEKGFSGSPLVTQSCLMKPALPDTLVRSLSANIYVNNIQEHLAVQNLVKVEPAPVPLYQNVVAYVLHDTNYDGLPTSTCEVSWGAFFGTATVIAYDDESGARICARALKAAKVLGPLMPVSPSQMRPTS